MRLCENLLRKDLLPRLASQLLFSKIMSALSYLYGYTGLGSEALINWKLCHY